MKTISISAALLFISSLSLSSAIECYVWLGAEDPLNLPLYECSQVLAARTNAYLSIYNFNESNAESAQFECLHDEYTAGVARFIYKGCIFSSIKGCDLPLPENTPIKDRKCKQCAENACNSASTKKAFAFISYLALMLLLIKLK